MRIRNVGRLKKKLRRLPDVAREEIRKGIALSADEIVELMRRIVPVDRGDLRDSIGWTWGATPKGRSVIATSVKAGDAGMVATIYAGGGDAFHARFVEFGTREMSARPFFYPSWRLSRKRARSRIARATTRAAKKVAAGR